MTTKFFKSPQPIAALGIIAAAIAVAIFLSRILRANDPDNDDFKGENVEAT